MRNSKQTSARAASAASKVLRDGRTGKASKTAAASVLAPHLRSQVWVNGQSVLTSSHLTFLNYAASFLENTISFLKNVVKHNFHFSEIFFLDFS